VDAYRKAIDGLDRALGPDREGHEEAAEVLRRLISRIDIAPRPGRGEVEVQVCGDPGASQPRAEQARNAKHCILGSGRRDFGDPVLRLSSQPIDPPTAFWTSVVF
jgi:hypothetical protein